MVSILRNQKHVTPDIPMATEKLLREDERMLEVCAGGYL
jgi:hypothetical protein